MVSFSEELLAEVDRVARKEHRSRGEMLREALRVSIIFYPFAMLSIGIAHTERVRG